MLSADEIRTRTTRAVRAATEAGRQLGLQVDEPVVLHEAFSVVVHLAPAPVVVRVPVVMPRGIEERLRLRQQRELDTVAWLYRGECPVVPPSPLVPLKPVTREGFSMTFWELAEVSEDHAPYSAADAALVVALHSALRNYPAGIKLPFLAPLKHSVPSLLEMLGALPGVINADDVERARREWAVLETVLGSKSSFEKLFPAAVVQTVHGDGPSYNMIRTVSGARFADFEDVNLGPIEWDLALCTPEDVASYNREAARLDVPALDPEILEVMNAARMLQFVATCALIPRLPLLAEGLKSTIETWRKSPFAGGVHG